MGRFTTDRDKKQLAEKDRIRCVNVRDFSDDSAFISSNLVSVFINNVISLSAHLSNVYFKTYYVYDELTIKFRNLMLDFF